MKISMIAILLLSLMACGIHFKTEPKMLECRDSVYEMEFMVQVICPHIDHMLSLEFSENKAYARCVCSHRDIFYILPPEKGLLEGDSPFDI